MLVIVYSGDLFFVYPIYNSAELKPHLSRMHFSTYILDIYSVVHIFTKLIEVPEN